jgi:hypothetical protein
MVDTRTTTSLIEMTAYKQASRPEALPLAKTT